MIIFRVHYGHFELWRDGRFVFKQVGSVLDAMFNAMEVLERTSNIGHWDIVIERGNEIGVHIHTETPTVPVLLSGLNKTQVYRQLKPYLLMLQSKEQLREH